MPSSSDLPKDLFTVEQALLFLARAVKSLEQPGLDFSMNQQFSHIPLATQVASFNSLYLGFLHESQMPEKVGLIEKRSFNSLYLGFLHESHLGIMLLMGGGCTFNSLYLGFLHESPVCSDNTASGEHFDFQFPLLGISP